ncbi:MAG: 2Fe-2S iron-sulfur cluster binding domain-containing protein [Ideonella sp.]|nr:2Fe-2S iron-sulfur cluster binding domain-containing protein [Ideonella sp.]MCC7457637.1 2Fe-2S iron-sulfur cluster binding domain-containing protein [Nitrospira sp.]
MAQWVSVWRAAQLVGVPRSVLQQRVRTGEIELHDGLLSTEALLRLYPHVDIERSGLFERVMQVQQEAFSRRVRERLLPSQEVLAQRLFRQSQELADVQRHLQRYHALVLELRDAMGALLQRADDAGLLALQRQLNDGLARALATEPVDALNVMDDMLKAVSALVTLRPSGHQFVVEGHESLLQAGLRAGLKLNYGCGNGTCGMCKVRVTSGEVIKCMPFDYRLSELERQQGYLLMCANTAASSELAVETLEASGPADIALQQIVTTARAVRELAPDTRLLHLQTPRSHRLRFLAGQSVTLGRAGSERTAGDDVRTTLPIASCPCDDRNLHFYVARERDDAFTRLLFDGAIKTGDAINLWGPSGEFVLRDSQRPLVFAACDTGFAPIKSLIEHALSLDHAASLSLFWLATRGDGHFQANQCRAWSEALDPFEYALFTDADAAAGARQIATAVRADQFEVDCDFYLAGPERFVDELGRALLEAGVPPQQVTSELV